MEEVVHHSAEVLTPPADLAVAQLAHRQHGVVSRGQLLALGLRRGAIDRRIRSGRLHPVHRGVYAVGHTRLTSRGRLWGAVLACGGVRVAVLSHRAAAAVLDLMPQPSGPVEVTTLRASRSTRLIRVHQNRALAPADITTIDGLRLTTPARTLIDLQDVLTPHRLERIVHRAEQLRLLGASELTPSPGRRSRALRDATRSLSATGPQITRNTLEERFLALVAHARLPAPLVNAPLHGYEPDFLWPVARLIAETDGAATHLTATAFEQDRARDAALLLAGYRVVRFTWRQVTDEPRRVADILSGLLRSA